MPGPIDEERLRKLATSLERTRERLAALADSIASTEEDIADVFEQIARRRPHDAERLQAMAEDARQFAAKERLRGAGADPPPA
jgi:acyl transferase domain-containing protein